MQKKRSEQKSPDAEHSAQRLAQRPGRSEADIAAITRDLEELEILGEVKTIARKHGVLLRAALSSSRTQTAVLARDAIIDFLRGRFRYSSPETGKLLRMDYTSVQESMRRTKARKDGKPTSRAARRNEGT